MRTHKNSFEGGQMGNDEIMRDVYDRYEARVFWRYKIGTWILIGVGLFCVGMVIGLGLA
jgi:hypothetical protein